MTSEQFQNVTIVSRKPTDEEIRIHQLLNPSTGPEPSSTYYRRQRMNQLTPEQFQQYAANPLGMDETVRGWCNLPDDKYFTVSVWPKAGVVNVTNVGRVVKSKKISKSDQKP